MGIPLRAICTISLWLCCLPLAGAAVPDLAQPDWKQLSAQQREILSPLAGEWDAMESFRRKKWLGIAERYASMSPEEQERVQRRMRDWAKLAPEERKQAREKYKTLQKVSPEQRESLRQNWEDYKALPEEEKKRLKAEAVRRPPVSTLPPPPPPGKVSQSAPSSRSPAAKSKSEALPK